MLLAAVELVLHSLIDHGKCEKKFGLLADQSLHLLCKFVYAVLVTMGTA